MTSSSKSVSKPKYGYCALTADFLHIGHIRFMKRCKSKCENLIVGVMTDEAVIKYKGCKPIMKFDDRKEIIDSLKFVYRTYPQAEFEFTHIVSRWKSYYGKDFLICDSEEHKREGADVIIPRTKGISSTAFKNTYIS